MAIRYILRSDDLAVGWFTADHENQLQLTTATLATESVTDTISGNSASWVWTSPSGSPNSADWPSGVWTIQVDVAAIGADCSLQDSTPAKVSSDASTSSGIGGLASWDSTTGTGLHLATTGTLDPAAGSASDRYGLDVRVASSNMMTAQTVTLNLNTSDTYAEGPWTAAAAEEIPFLVMAPPTPAGYR